MATSQTKATAKYKKAQGIITKSFDIHKDKADKFKRICEKKGVPQSRVLMAVVDEYISKYEHLLED